MPFWIDAQYRFAVLKEKRGGMAEVLPLLAIDDHLPLLLIGQIEQRDRVAARGFVLGGQARNDERTEYQDKDVSHESLPFE